MEEALGKHGYEDKSLKSNISKWRTVSWAEVCLLSLNSLDVGVNENRSID